MPTKALVNCACVIMFLLRHIICSFSSFFAHFIRFVRRTKFKNFNFHGDFSKHLTSQKQTDQSQARSKKRKKTKFADCAKSFVYIFERHSQAKISGIDSTHNEGARLGRSLCSANKTNKTTGVECDLKRQRTVTRIKPASF